MLWTLWTYLAAFFGNDLSAGICPPSASDLPEFGTDPAPGTWPPPR